MDDSNFLSFSFPSHKRKSKPLLTWDDRPKISFQIPKVILKPIALIDSTEILGNIYEILSKSHKITKNFHFYSANKKIFQEKNKFKFINRIIHADSLIGMGNLINNGFKEKIQMIYFDPPFGIEFNAKFHSGNQKTEGYIDSWKNGLSSYLEYLRERILLCHELLHLSGSIFIQIGDDNVHYVRCLLDEIFGQENFVSQITFRTAISTNKINSISDYLLWYARDKTKLFRRKLFCERSEEKSSKTFTYSDSNPKSGKIRKFKAQELVKRINPTKSLRIDRNYSIDYKGKKFLPPKGFEWRWNKNALNRLINLDRIHEINGKLYGKRYEKDFPVMLLTNLWTDTSTSTFAARKHYSVHTNPKVIRRCIAMTTKPGDIVLDPTSGSGTTAMVAEDLYRKWIVFDTSPTSILSTFNWLMGTNFPDYKWDDSANDFTYTQVKKVSLSDLAHNRTLNQELQYDLPMISKKNDSIIRVVSSFSIEMIYDIKIPNWENFIIDILKNNGILLPSGKNISLDNINLQKNLENSIQELNLPIAQAKIGKEIYNIIINKPATKIDERKIITFLESPVEALKNHNWIIIGSFYSFRFIQKLEKIRKKKVKSQSTNQRKILLGLYHPDLLLKELNFDNHPESIRIVGSLNRNLKDSKNTLRFLDPFKNNYEHLPNDQLAVWIIFKLEEDEKKAPNITFIQCPLYKDFLSKSIKPFYYSSIDINDYLIKFKKKEYGSIIGLMGIDLRGTPHFSI
ncbi:MAG: site-specific DNA-methyltransferase [Promethearchaeota archaeon]